MYLYYCYRDWYDYLYTIGFLVTFKITDVGFTIIGSLTSSLCSVSVSYRIIDGIDSI